MKDFEPVTVVLDEKEDNPFKDIVFNKDVINIAISSGNVPVLLVDEFESKFYELKKIVASSGGGILRELFDQIVQTRPFQLVIGNGPASGYEVAKDKGGDADRRIMLAAYKDMGLSCFEPRGAFYTFPCISTS